MKSYRADKADMDTLRTIQDNQLDITGADGVDIAIDKQASGYVVWVNVNGVCAMRICRARDCNVIRLHMDARHSAAHPYSGTDDTESSHSVPQVDKTAPTSTSER